MKTKLVAIGNSKGVRIPHAVIEQCGFKENVEMRVANGVVTLTPAHGLRGDWESAFERMAAAGDDGLLLPDTLSPRWDDDEWTW